jgi:hypothetical protein
MGVIGRIFFLEPKILIKSKLNQRNQRLQLSLATAHIAVEDSGRRATPRAETLGIGVPAASLRRSASDRSRRLGVQHLFAGGAQ